MTRGLILGAGLAALLVLGGSGAAQSSLTWTAGAVGGGWYAITGGLAELLHDKAGLAIKVIPGGGTVNPVLVHKGEAEIGMGLPPLLRAALSGEDPFKNQAMPDLRAVVGNLSLNILHLYMGVDTRFASMSLEEIVRGKKPIRLAISKPGSSDVWVFEKIMAFYGVCGGGRVEDCYKAWELAGARFFRGSYAEQARAFRDRKVDGTFAFVALPGAPIAEASAGRALKFIAFPEPLLAHLATFGLGPATIPAGTYPKAANADQSLASAAMGTTITVSSRMADELAYTLTRTLNDHPDRLRKIHASLADYDPAQGHLNLGVPLHPGAERYYREMGYLK